MENSFIVYAKVAFVVESPNVRTADFIARLKLNDSLILTDCPLIEHIEPSPQPLLSFSKDELDTHFIAMSLKGH